MLQEPWNDNGGDDVGVTFRDMITLALAAFVVIVILMLPHINDGKKAESDASPPGNVMVEATWPPEMDVDVDLWVKSPGDVPVGYSNKSGLIFNLLRDDLGKQADPTKINYEVAYSRGIPPGEYIVNLHLYRDTPNIYPVPVTVNIRCSPTDTNATAMRQLLSTEVSLTHEGQEYTALRFKLDEKCNLDQSSVNNVYRPLRSGGK